MVPSGAGGEWTRPQPWLWFGEAVARTRDTGELTGAGGEGRPLPLPGHAGTAALRRGGAKSRWVASL
jgi:hypothetical protein